MGFLYFIIAIVLFALLTPVVLLVTLYFVMERGLEKTAIGLDQIANVIYGFVLNYLFITKKGHRYGSVRETISLVTGINARIRTLTPSGKKFKQILDKVFEPNHCENAVKEHERYISNHML